MDKHPEILVLVGSPRETGRSAELGARISELLEMQDADVTFFEISKYPVAACTGCGACSQTGECIIVGDAWNVLAKHLQSCDALVLLAPVYFAGPTGWLKAALDRCQMFWARKYILEMQAPAKRPAYLVVIGEGNDPFGCEPLVTICTSALNCVNLRISPERTYRLIGEDYDMARAEEIVFDVLAEYREET